MTDERRNHVDGRRQGKDRRRTQASPQDAIYPGYNGAERRAGDRREGVSRRAAR